MTFPVVLGQRLIDPGSLRMPQYKIGLHELQLYHMSTCTKTLYIELPKVNSEVALVLYI